VVATWQSTVLETAFAPTGRQGAAFAFGAPHRLRAAKAKERAPRRRVHPQRSQDQRAQARLGDAQRGQAQRGHAKRSALAARR
jgi:hypothetical protein